MDAPRLTLRELREAAEREMICDALELHANNRTHTAAHLGISRRTLLNKIYRYQIDMPPRPAGGAE